MPSERREGYQGSQGNFAGDGDVYSLDCGNDFTGVYLSQSFTNCTLGIRVVYCMSIIISIKPLKMGSSGCLVEKRL